MGALSPLVIHSDSRLWRASNGRLAWLAAMLALAGLAGCAGPTASAPRHSGPLEVTLQRRNWESHGTDHVIESDGRWTVHSVALGRRKPIRSGTLSPVALAELRAAVARADLPTRRGPFAPAPSGETGWWGYELIVKTGGEVNVVRFHSEDRSVPGELTEVVRLVEASTR